MKEKIIKVTAQRLHNGKYRYFGELEDGTVETLRFQATRLYARAFVYQDEVGPGKTELARRVLYGKKAKMVFGEMPIATLAIVLTPSP